MKELCSMLMTRFSFKEIKKLFLEENVFVGINNCVQNFYTHNLKTDSPKSNVLILLCIQ